MKQLIIAALLTASSTVVLAADNVIVTETKSWKSVPITVDPNGNVYSVEGSQPTEGDYYYTYSGYRCFKVRRNIPGVEPTVYHAKAGGSSIYCYPE